MFGIIMKQEDAERLTGQSIHPDAFNLCPAGARVHVVLEEVPETWKGIQLTQQSQQKEPVGSGWIIAAGSGVVVPAPYPGTVQVSDPEEMLGLHVIFSATMGMPIRFDITDRDFKSQVLVMETRGIRGIDLNPKSHIQRVKEREYA